MEIIFFFFKCIQGSRYKLIYDGMYHMDIPKTRQYDTGKIEVLARSSVGEALTTTELNVIPRKDDYRNVLKNSPRRKLYILKHKTLYHLIWLKLFRFKKKKYAKHFTYNSKIKYNYLLVNISQLYSILK